MTCSEKVCCLNSLHTQFQWRTCENLDSKYLVESSYQGYIIMAFLLYVPERVIHNGGSHLQIASVQKMFFSGVIEEWRGLVFHICFCNL